MAISRWKLREEVILLTDMVSRHLVKTSCHNEVNNFQVSSMNYFIDLERIQYGCHKILFTYLLDRVTLHCPDHIVLKSILVHLSRQLIPLLVVIVDNCLDFINCCL